MSQDNTIDNEQRRIDLDPTYSYSDLRKVQKLVNKIYGYDGYLSMSAVRTDPDKWDSEIIGYTYSVVIYRGPRVFTITTDFLNDMMSQLLVLKIQKWHTETEVSRKRNQFRKVKKYRRIC